MIQSLQKLLLVTALLVTSFSIAQQTSHVPGELLVQLKPGTDRAELARKLENDLQADLISFNCISDVMNIYQLQFASASIDLDRLLKSFILYPEILVAQKNHYVYERETIPSDTLFDTQWHLKNVGQTGGLTDADIDAPEAWDITTGGLTTHGDSIVVCIIEGSGVDINHIDLKDNMWKNYAEIPGDGIDNDNNGYVDDYDGWHVINLDDNIGAGTHGTRVAGMIGATGDNVTGVSGVSWNVQMMVVQGQQASNEATVIAAYTYPLKMRKRYNETLGQEGAFVVATNSSWGIDGGDADDSPLWCAMYDSLGHYGILNIGATTNDNVNVDVVGDMPTTCTSEFLVGVTMTNNQDLRTVSGYGTTHVDLGAPGKDVRTTSPGGYLVVSGTSFATPCVVGSVALAYATPCAEFINLVKFDPAAAALDMRHYLLSSVDQNAALLTEVASGGRANVRSYIDSILAACNPSSCISPYNLNVTNISDTAAQINWQGFGTDYVVYLKEGNGPLVAIDASGVNNMTPDTLIPCTWYTVYLQTNCGTDSSVFSFPYSFQTDGCCNNPELFVSGGDETSLTLSWENVLYATSYDLRYKLHDETAWTEITNVTFPYTFNTLTACANYDFQIHTQCADSTHGYGVTHTFTTFGCGACTEKNYCAVSGANTTFEWIQSIAINGFSNTTGSNNGWLQSNQIITALTPGQSYNVTLTPGFGNMAFDEGYSIWIDFDQDGIFETTEAVMNNLISNTSVTGIINIPGAAEIGVTKMRIGMNATFAPEICPVSAFYGEYEDYCVYIGPQAGLPENENAIHIYPNPANDWLYIESATPVQKIEIMNYAGELVQQNQTADLSKIALENLSSGIYMIKVYTADGISVSRFIKHP